MPTPTDITTGTISLANNGTTVTGVGTAWLASDIRQGDLFIWIEGGDGFWSPIVQSVESNTSLTLAEPWEGSAISGGRYRLRYQWDSSRVSAQARQLIETLGNGNVLALSGLTGPGVPVFDGPHSMTIKPETDFINGVAYDVQVDTLADRDAYDGQPEGFAVLVSDVGDGRSAIYSKVTNTSGDWSDPAYITGPVGPAPVITADVVSLPPGSTAGVTVTPITGGYDLEFELPEAEGFYNAGVYDIGTTYTTDQVVRYSGSSFIALQAVPAGTAPSSAFPPVDTAFWQVLAAKGADGLGTGDVVGPSGAVDDNIATFNGTTGKVVGDSGVPITSIVRPDIPQPVALTQTQRGQFAANSGQSWERIGDPVIASGVSQVQWTDLQFFRFLRCRWDLIVIGNTGGVFGDASITNGTSWQQAAGSYRYQGKVLNNGVQSYFAPTESTNMPMSGAVYGANYASGAIEFHGWNVPNALSPGQVKANLQSLTSWSVSEIDLITLFAGTKNAFRIYPVGGTLTGTFVMEGIRG